MLYDDGTFIINELPENRKTDVGVTEQYAAMKDNGSNYVFSSSSARPWYDNKDSIKSVEIGSDISTTSTVLWFSSMKNCTSISLTNLNTSRLTTMGQMFSSCAKLTSLDLSSFDTSNVTNMGMMFYGCEKLITIYASNVFDTAQATNSSGMFYNCTELRGGNGTAFDASKVDKTYARIDGGPNSDTPGYFTEK